MPVTDDQRADYAVQLLNDERFKDILVTLKELAVYEWATTKSCDQERREELWRDLQAIGRLENRLRSLKDDAELNRRKLERKFTRPKRS